MLPMLATLRLGPRGSGPGFAALDALPPGLRQTGSSAQGWAELTKQSF